MRARVTGQCTLPKAPGPHDTRARAGKQGGREEARGPGRRQTSLQRVGISGHVIRLVFSMSDPLVSDNTESWLPGYPTQKKTFFLLSSSLVQSCLVTKCHGHANE